MASAAETVVSNSLALGVRELSDLLLYAPVSGASVVDFWRVDDKARYMQHVGAPPHGAQLKFQCTVFFTIRGCWKREGEVGRGLGPGLYRFCTSLTRAGV